MCVQCVLQCSRAYTFKQLCEKSENILRQYMTPEFQAQLRAAAEQRTKTELQEQLQFPDDNIANVVIEGEEVLQTEFDTITYPVDDSVS